MLTSGDILDADLGLPTGREAGFPRPVVVVTAQRILDQSPAVVQVVPLTTTLRGFRSEVVISHESSGLRQDSAAQCHQIRAVSASRLHSPRGNIGSVDLLRLRETIALLLDID
jgi:mRNA interferase MazF